MFSDRKFVSDRTAANTSCGATSAAVKSPALLNEEVSVSFGKFVIVVNSNLE